ncbi:unnamed protein product [Acanthoscelides obtectus]|uniref:Uncharacterized protein n=1 Tax=Acanthoscelides obtectus TaxID=200917 RepID=A0A9P0KKL2_ACAOB|nr:unnamed protein product [Acanthoscelides obtectus]CAK1638213.1 hypothetical protein AOBTE_LOCUS10457 [Acanthoscelides obtectus]
MAIFRWDRLIRGLSLEIISCFYCFRLSGAISSGDL